MSLASHNEQHIVSAFEYGAADYVMKPFNAQEVLARAATHIQLRQKTIALKQAQQQLETIVSYMQDGLLVVDQAGLIQFANPAAAHMVKQPLEPLVGQQLGLPVVEKRTTQIEILRLNGAVGVAKITVAQAKWKEQPAAIVCLRAISDRAS